MPLDLPARFFNTEDQIAEAQHDGWRDSPGPSAEQQEPPSEPQPNPDVGKLDVLTMTVPEARAAIEEETSLAALKAILARENTRDRGPRVGVLNAIDERIGELETGE